MNQYAGSMIPRPPFAPLDPGFRDRIAALSADGIHFGTIGWRYPGWAGQIYTGRHYLRHGSFCEHRLRLECLPEYAFTFPTVCHHSFYPPPLQDPPAALVGQLPPGFTVAVKAPAPFTDPGPYTMGDYNMGTLAAKRSQQTFLNPCAFTEQFLSALEPIRQWAAPVLLIFQRFTRENFPSGRAFLSALAGFLRHLPAGDWRYSVAIQNRWLHPDYFNLLRAHGVAHCFSQECHGPTLAEQLVHIPQAFTAPFTCAWLNLPAGVSHEGAFVAFQPYVRTVRRCQATRTALAALIDACCLHGRTAYLYVSNLIEGSAPCMVSAVTAACPPIGTLPAMSRCHDRT